MSPILPTYTAQRNIDAGLAEPLRNEAHIPYQNVQKIAQAGQQIAQAWSDANDTIQATEAKARFGASLADIQARAAMDPDFKNSEGYYKEIQKARDTALSGVENQFTAQKIGLELDYDANIAKIKIDADFKQKQVQYGKIVTQTRLDDLLRNKLAATGNEVLVYDDRIQELLNDNIQSGVVSWPEADKMLKAAQITAVKYEIYNDGSTKEDDSEILKQLRDPSGKYAFLAPDDRLKLVEDSQRRIFQNNQTFKRENELVKNERFDNIFKKANEGTLTLKDLDEELSAAERGDPGALGQKEILNIREGLIKDIDKDLNVIANNDPKAQEYIRLIENFIDDETDRQKGREIIAQAYADGILSKKEAAFLNKIKMEAEDIEWNRKSEEGRFKSIVTAIGSFFRGKAHSTDAEAAVAIKKLINGVADGEPMDETAQKVLAEDRVNTKPEIKSFSDKGQLMRDPVTGVEAIVYPDGRIEPRK